MGALVQIVLLGLVAVAAARPSVVSEREAKGQTIKDSSDPSVKPGIEEELIEAYKGGKVPVVLQYDEPETQGEEEARRALRDTEESGEQDKSEIKQGEGQSTGEIAGVDIPQESILGNKNSKLLSLEARENDDNAKYGLGIQSRNKVPADVENGEEELMKPFVYNIQPLSFYSSETKEQENIINYINKIKEMRENQIRFEAAKKEEAKPVGRPEQRPVENHEDAVVTEVEEDDGRPVKQRIKHYQIVIKPFGMDPQGQAYGGAGQTGHPVYPAATSFYQNPYQQSVHPYQQPAFPYQQSAYPYLQTTFQNQQSPFTYQQPEFPYQQSVLPYQQQGHIRTPNQVLPYYQESQQPSMVYLPNPFKSAASKSGNMKLLDSYFPIVISNPFNSIYAALSDIVVYGEAADVCKSKKGRVVDDEGATEVELPSRKFGVGIKKEDSWPKFTRLKVRRGGVAIAGPGGIATAGSGGTAIVGPGGTAYTTRDGTAVVGPGGRVIHVPEFPLYAKSVEGEFVPPEGSRTVAEGPVVYYDQGSQV